MTFVAASIANLSRCASPPAAAHGEARTRYSPQVKNGVQYWSGLGADLM